MERMGSIHCTLFVLGFAGAHGWPDLALTMKPPTGVVRLQFDGKVYEGLADVK